MRTRRVCRIHALAVSALAAWPAIVPLAGQTVSPQQDVPRRDAKDAVQTGTPPRTAWGRSGPAGHLVVRSLTPLQRPAAFRDQEFFAPEEAAARETSSRADRPPQPGSVGSYNAHWFDRGRVDPSRRTSLIVDPANGRLPPLTPEGQAQVAARAERQRGRSDGWLNFPAWTRCITYHGVPPVSTGYNNTYQIFQTPDYVAILGREHSRRAHYSARRAPAPRRTHPPVERGFPRVTGRARRWLSRPATSAIRRSIDSRRRRTCAQSSGSPASTKTRSITNSRSWIPTRTPNLGPPSGRCRGSTTIRSTSMRVMRGTTRCRTPSAPLARKRGRPRNSAPRTTNCRRCRPPGARSGDGAHRPQGTRRRLPGSADCTVRPAGRVLLVEIPSFTWRKQKETGTSGF